LGPGRRAITVLNEPSGQPVEISSGDLSPSDLIQKAPSLASLGGHDLNSIFDDIKWGTGRVVAIDRKYVREGEFSVRKRYEILEEIEGQPSQPNSQKVKCDHLTYIVEDDRGILHHVESRFCEMA
jgi:hypothetical protein